MPKDLGAIYTPEGYARILVNWAIRSKTDTVLDMGIGKGVFVYQAYKRLLSLGAEKDEAANQIFGSEIDKSIFDVFTKEANAQGLIFNNLYNQDFFNSEVPKVDVVIGNPPYVRRRGMRQDNFELIRKKTLDTNSNIKDGELSHLSDLYIYFLLTALTALKPGGKVATIVADTWLNTRYGNILKKYFLDQFEVNQIISLDRSVFEDAEVKAVLILASKKKELGKPSNSVRFVRIRNGMSIDTLTSFVLEGKTKVEKDIIVREVNSKNLDAKLPWGAILKSTVLFEEISNKDIIKPIREVANLHIGLQTLAEDFFVVSNEEKFVVEKEYLFPFVHSVATFEKLILNETDVPEHYVFYCANAKSSLINTRALKYILKGETSKVTVRGKGTSVIGYQEKQRIKKANRPNWYDIKTEIEKKTIAEILIPRFIYKEYSVLWNIAKYIPGGSVIQFFPKLREDLFTPTIDIRVFLAILTSSFSEIVFRIYSQVYGGGTFNLRINVIKDVPTIDVTQLTVQQQKKLMKAYDNYLKTKTKIQIDLIIYKILELTSEQISEIDELLVDLKSMATSAKKAAHPKNSY